MSRRTEKVASVIQRVVGEAIMHKLHDPRISPVTSITSVKVAGDLSLATVSVSVMGSEGQQHSTLDGLNSTHGYLQSLVAKGLSTRQCPSLRFELDQSIKQGIATLQLIDQAMSELADKQEDQADDQAPADSPSEADQSGEHG